MFVCHLEGQIEFFYTVNPHPIHANQRQAIEIGLGSISNSSSQMRR